MKIDDKRQLPFQVAKLTGQVQRLEQLLARLGELVPMSQKITPRVQQEANHNPDAYPADPISLKDAAKLLGVHQGMIYRLIKQGDLRAWTLPGGHKRVSRAEVLAFPEPCQLPPPPSSDGKRRPRRSRVKELSQFTQATLERFGIQIGEEDGHGA